MKKQSKLLITGNLPIAFYKEGSTIIASCPVIDLVTCGDTYEEARQNFTEALQSFLEECIEMDTIDSVLISCGFTKHQHKKSAPSWESPESIAQSDIQLDRLVLCPH